MTMFLIQILYILVFSSEISCNEKVCSLSDVHALILARGGSKGIPHKNLEKINGISLLARTIMTINRTKIFEHIWVSTDSDQIASEALKYGALIYKRAELYALDETPSIESVKEFLAVYNTIEKFALFQCTSVFLKARYISQAFNIFQAKDCVFAVTRTHKLRWKQQSDKIIPLNFDPAFRPRRQDWDGELVETGMFYFSNRLLVEQNQFQNDRCGVVEIEPQDSLEIDTYDDLLLARSLTNSTTDVCA